MRKKWVVCGSVYRNCHFLTAEISFLRRIRNYEFQESVLNGSESQKVRGNLASKSFCVKWGLQTNKLPSHNEHFLDFILPQHFFRPYDRNKMKMFCDPQRNISWVILEFWKLVKYLRALYTQIPTCKNINLNFGPFSKLMPICNILDDISCCQVKVKVDQEVFKLSLFLSLKSRDAKMNNDGWWKCRETLSDSEDFSLSSNSKWLRKKAFRGMNWGEQ